MYGFSGEVAVEYAAVVGGLQSGVLQGDSVGAGNQRQAEGLRGLGTHERIAWGDGVDDPPILP